MPLAVCATPIGNLDDVTLRVLEELRAADVVLCEDTRHTRGLLARHGIRRGGLVSYHEHNEAKRTAEILPRLEQGERIALVSDAGMPGISDPGARLVAAALEAGTPVTVLPGPSAVDAALVASGYAGEQYRFVGFLPRGQAALHSLWEELRSWPSPVVAFESPQRLPATLRSLAEVDSEQRVKLPEAPDLRHAALVVERAGRRDSPGGVRRDTKVPRRRDDRAEQLFARASRVERNAMHARWVKARLPYVDAAGAHVSPTDLERSDETGHTTKAFTTFRGPGLSGTSS